jgi:LmbE family N-acetylglucosaminyl deacetylase
MAKSILFVFAHPDDESHWSSGVAVRCHDEGARTALVTATHGERGTTGGLCSAEELAAVREQELREAARALKFDELEILPYEDKELSNVPHLEIRRTLVAAIRRTRPQIVVTFDPNGMTLHADHLAISRFTSDAIAAAADPRWFPELGTSHTVTRLLWTPPVFPWQGGEFPPLAGVDFLVDTAHWWRDRAKALAAHKTQHAMLDKLYLKNPEGEYFLSFDVLRQGWGPPLQNRPESDVFAGISL